MGGTGARVAVSRDARVAYLSQTQEKFTDAGRGDRQPGAGLSWEPAVGAASAIGPGRSEETDGQHRFPLTKAGKGPDYPGTTEEGGCPQAKTSAS